MSAAPPGGGAHLPGPRCGAAGQQRRGEGDPPSLPDPEEQLHQSQRERDPNPSHLHNHFPQPQDAWAQPAAGSGGYFEILCASRATAAFAIKNHGSGLKGYENIFGKPFRVRCRCGSGTERVRGSGPGPRLPDRWSYRHERNVNFCRNFFLGCRH